MTEEHSLAALEAAHIKPFALDVPHTVSNGILLRSDIHRLFDACYITVTPDYRVLVSDGLKEHISNGRSYYPFTNQPWRCCPNVLRISQDPKHLRASHIKPWRDADDAERLNGFNGLLLSPHVDHLFDQGYISFAVDRRLLIVPEVRVELLDKWSIDETVNVGEFNHDQQAFLEYHRQNVFNRGSGTR